MMLPDEYQKYVGQSFKFEDGNSITIVQIKRRDEDQYWVAYEVVTGPGLPARFSMEFNQFKEYYGHLFTTA